MMTQHSVECVGVIMRYPTLFNKIYLVVNEFHTGRVVTKICTVYLFNTGCSII